MDIQQISRIIEQMKRGEVHLTGGGTSDTVWTYRYDQQRQQFFHIYSDEEWNAHYDPVEQSVVENQLSMFGEQIVKYNK